MLNEERVKLMTQITLFQEKEERKSLEIDRNRRRDYIVLQVIKAWISYTLLFLMALVCVLVIAQTQPGGWGNAEILLYGALLILVYTLGAVLSVLLGRKKAARRYDIAERKVGRYEQMLRRLKWIYEKENRK